MFAELSELFVAADSALEKIVSEDLAELNALAAKLGVEYIVI